MSELLVYVAWSARLSEQTKDGSKTIEHLKFAAKSGNRTAIKELEGPPFPSELYYLWTWYENLKTALPRNAMDGSREVTWDAIRDWAELKDLRLEPHEVDALVLLDHAARNYASVLENAA